MEAPNIHIDLLSCNLCIQNYTKKRDCGIDQTNNSDFKYATHIYKNMMLSNYFCDIVP